MRNRTGAAAWVTLAGLLLLALTVAACESAPPTVGVVETAARPTPTAEVDSAPSPAPTPAPTAAPTRASTPTPSLVPTPTATPVPADTPTPTPTRTPRPTFTPMPTATPTQQQVGQRVLAEYVPWFRRPPAHWHWRIRDGLSKLWVERPEFVVALVQTPFFSSESIMSPDSSDSARNRNDTYGLEMLLEIAAVDEDLALGIARLDWFADGIPDEPYQQEELEVMELLLEMAENNLEVARAVLGLEWLADGVNPNEREILIIFAGTPDDEAELMVRIMGEPWLRDGIPPKRIASVQPTFEKEAIRYLRIIHDASPELAVKLMGYLDESLPLLDIGMLSGVVSAVRADVLERLTAEPWFTDGLDASERAFLLGVNATLFADMLDFHDLRSKTIRLPLAGEVRLWALSHKQFRDTELYVPDESGTGGSIYRAHRPLDWMEEAVRKTERIMGVPFPVTDVLMLTLLGEPVRWPGAGAEHWGTHFFDQGVSRTIFHETAHYYFDYNVFKERWLVEGGAEFVNWFTRLELAEEVRSGSVSAAGNSGPHVNTSAETWERTWEYASNAPIWCTEQTGAKGIQDMIDRDLDCSYEFGRYLLLGIYDLIGEDAMRSALRELYLTSEELVESYEPHLTEEEIYRVFLKHVPAGKEGEFRAFYKRVHGGPFVEG